MNGASVVFLLLGACGGVNAAPDLGPPDSARTVDLAGAAGCVKDTDCKGSRLCIGGVCTTPPDQAATPNDAAPSVDASAPPDAAIPADLAISPDLSNPPDLAIPADLATPPDLAILPDLAISPDLAMLPDSATPPDLAMRDLVSNATLSTCVGPTTSYTSCDTYCATLGQPCADSCVAPSGQAVGGAFAYQPGSACGGSVGGVTYCSFGWNDAVGASPRWRCCCGSSSYNPWSTCVGPTASYGTCTAYCTSLGKHCYNGCLVPGGSFGTNGALAWGSGQACGGAPSGNASCDFTWNDSVGAPPRWECCCL